MKYFVGFIFLIAAIGLVGLHYYEQYDVEYWMTAPELRVEKKWKAELAKSLKHDKKLQTAIYLISDIEMTTTDQDFKDLIDKSKPPFKKAKNGKYVLKIQYMPWIEEMKYGYLIQHEFFDETDNKVNEFTYNIEIGRLW